MIPQLLDRVEGLLPTLLEYCKRLDTIPSRRVAAILENPWEELPPALGNLYITVYPRTVVHKALFRVTDVGYARLLSVRWRRHEVGAAWITESWVIFYPILQKAPDRVLLTIMAHEFYHVGFLKEESVQKFETELAERFPEAFMSADELADLTKPQRELLKKEETISEFSFMYKILTGEVVKDLKTYERLLKPSPTF